MDGAKKYLLVRVHVFEQPVVAHASEVHQTQIQISDAVGGPLSLDVNRIRYPSTSDDNASN